MKKLKFYLAGLTLGCLALFSCTKEDTNAFSDSELLKTSTVIDRISEADFQSGMESASDNSSMRPADMSTTETTPSCATIDIQTGPNNSFPKVFTLDFGSGCSHNGITRSGVLTITLSGFLLVNGTEMTIQRDNYYVNGYKVEGTVTYVNMTTDLAVPQWTRTISDGQITTPAGLVYTHSGTRTVKQISGVGTLILADNVFEISSGTATVTRPGGSSLTATITTPLIKKYYCPHISQGVLHLEGTYLDGDLDYGDDSCDDIAVYTHSDGQSYSVHL